MIHTVATYCLVVLFFCFGLNLIRLIKGPSLADRILAADAFALNLVAVAGLYSVCVNSSQYLDLVLVFSLLGFIGIITFAKFLGRGKIVE